MALYMFHLELPEMNDDIAATIPAHRAHINQLFADGKLLCYSVSQNRHSIWCVADAGDVQQAMELIAAMPLHPFYTEIQCHQLLFHNSLPAAMPAISLN